MCGRRQYAEDSNDYEEGGLIDTLADGSWTATEAPEPSYTTIYQDVTLDSVSCADAGSCAAVGTYYTSNNPTAGGDNGTAQAIIESFSDGSCADIQRHSRRTPSRPRSASFPN